MAVYLPEGCLIDTPENSGYLRSAAAFQEAVAAGVILEARASLCDHEHNLIVDLGFAKGIIPRVEGALGIEEGTTRDIAIISRVNKPVCFLPLSLTRGEDGRPIALLSRREAQRRCRSEHLDGLLPGDIIRGRVTYLESFGCFVDIGCGIPSMIPIDQISVSRISHPSDRFSVGDDILAVVKGREGDRILLSHKELLGNWQQNADLFRPGETVPGIVRSVEEYGVFVELTPNLAGLAEPCSGALPGQNASVYIKNVIPEKMKVKLIIVDSFEDDCPRRPLRYFIGGGHIDSWRYSPESSERRVETVFDG